MTYDLDLCPGWEPANLDRLAAALRELDARLRDLPADVELPPITGRTLREMMIGTWRTSAGDLDILREIPSADRHHPNSYDELVRRATSREFLGCTIYVANLGDIIASKEARRPAEGPGGPSRVAGAARRPGRGGPVSRERRRRRPQSVKSPSDAEKPREATRIAEK